MQVFKAFIKTSLRFLPQTMLYFVIFCTIAFLISNNAQDTGQSGFRSAELDIGIADEDDSAASRALTEYLGASHRVERIGADKEEVLDRLFYRDLDYILVLPDRFGERLLKGEKEGLFETIQIPGAYNSLFVDEQVNSYLRTASMFLAGGHDFDYALSRAGELLAAASGQVEIYSDGETEASSSMTGIYYFYQFMPYILVTMILCGLTPILIIFWDKNLARRMACSAASFTGRSLQLALGSVVYCIFLWALLILVSRVFYGSGLFTENGLYCVLNSFLLVPLALAVSLIIGSFAPSFNVINMLNNIICLGMSFLCGVFVPQQMLGDSVLAVSKFLPFYWYVKNNDAAAEVLAGGFSAGEYWRNLGIQALFAVALFAVALAVAKMKNAKQKE